jgi:RNA polymerase sigma-54 factor
MALELRQQLKLSQQLVMTPQLQQAIKLLQLSRMELVELVQQELEENPVLEEGAEVEPADEAESVEATIEEPVRDEGQVDNQVDEIKGEEEGLGDIDWQTYLESYSLGGTVASSYEDDEDRPSFENLLTRSGTLADHLMWQMTLTRFTEDEQRLSAEIIGNIDDDGYLQASVEDLAIETGASPDAIEELLLKIQEFDPPGVGCRNLQECLLVQLRHLGLEGTLADRILSEQIDALEKRNYPLIAKALGVPIDEVFAAAKFIATLDPRPGSPFGEEDVHYIAPDIFVHKVGSEYVVVLNEEGLPNLKINSFYRSALAGSTEVDKETGDYIQEKMRGAVWLIKSIHQRQRTIYRVAKSILKFQRKFLDLGIEHLKPLVLRDVATDIDMHESTISRVTTNKYMQTPRGLFELKYFFNSGISTTGGDSVASESVKMKIKEIISGENPKKPFSDQKIVVLLHEVGIDIARRTVTKYREMLGVGSSTERKRHF